CLRGLIILFASMGVSALAQSTQETRAFDAAIRSFQLGTYDRAHNELATFVEQFPASPKAPEALLLQAQCAVRLKQLDAARDILTTNAARAGDLSDQYRYWLGETHIRATNFQAAADTFARLILDFPTSPRLLEAAYGEALARFRLKQFPKVIELLSSPSGVFRRAARMRTDDDLVTHGDLLLAESYLEQRQFAEATEFLNRLSDDRLSSELKWRRQYLVCRTLVLDHKFDAALAVTTNLLTLAPASGEAEFIAESTGLRARILEQLGDFEAAAEAYEQNLAPGTPLPRRRQALLKTVELTLAQNKLSEAAQKLETFLLQNPEEKTSEFAMLALGELYLRQHVTRKTATNDLQIAAGYFDRLITNQPPGQLRGQALLQRGWCYWIENKYPEATGAFRSAVDLLGPAQDQAVARLKLGDCLFQLKDYTNAMAQYRLAATQYSDLPRVRDNLVELAWHQLLRASLEVRDFNSASEAVDRLLQDYPTGAVADYSLLIVAQNFSSAGKYPQARALFSRFLQMFPQSPLLPEVELAMARALGQEEQFGAAIQKYEQWLARYSDHKLMPKALYNLARTHYRAGNDTNALNLFTNFLARFPTNELAPRAQMWVANFYYNTSDFLNAERSFQMLFQNTNWSGNPLAYEARMMAGRAAFARQAYGDAEGYFTNLVNDRACPADILVQAFFAYGDTLTYQASNPPRLEKFSEAREAFSRIPQLFPTSPLAPAALGRVGDCYLQLAKQDAKLYDSAAEAYRDAIKSPGADVHVRSQAEVGLGIVLEKQAALRQPPENKSLLVEARDRYLNVFNGSNLREDEKPSAFWVKEAGFAAARLAEDQREWQVAANIYQRLSKVLPPIQSAVEKKLGRALDQTRLARPN
ncbi:MAG TPA: tetratricopeptide repeat protein, partial [Verrucomicrobiae bacterium]|nr:tetratricopeptide repeat protein [Verrucomicrobiae bacterium]